MRPFLLVLRKRVPDQMSFFRILVLIMLAEALGCATSGSGGTPQRGDKVATSTLGLGKGPSLYRTILYEVRSSPFPLWRAQPLRSGQ